MNIIIDKRMRTQEKEYLSQFGTLIEIEPQNSVYDEISSHPDIFFTKINNQIFMAPNLKLDNLPVSACLLGSENVENKYPLDIKYNVCQIGNNVIHDFRYTDKNVLKYINDQKLNKIQVNQGYSKCSISVTSSNSCITSDKGIYDTLQNSQIDILFLEEEIISLLDKNGNKTKMNGFIGGATGIIDNKFILFGDSSKLKQKSLLLSHLQKHKLELIDFKDLDIYDYGGLITF